MEIHIYITEAYTLWPRSLVQGQVFHAGGPTDVCWDTMTSVWVQARVMNAHRVSLGIRLHPHGYHIGTQRGCFPIDINGTACIRDTRNSVNYKHSLLRTTVLYALCERGLYQKAPEIKYTVVFIPLACRCKFFKLLHV